MSRARQIGLGLASMAVALALGGGARAQAYVRADCLPAAAPVSRFDNATHAAWYRRFWTGQCQGLSFLVCHKGSPYWNAFVDTVTDRAPPARKAAVKAQACRIGRAVGYEWARDNAVRRISTSDLFLLQDELNRSPDVVVGLARLEQKAQAKLRR